MATSIWGTLVGILFQYSEPCFLVVSSACGAGLTVWHGEVCEATGELADVRTRYFSGQLIMSPNSLLSTAQIILTCKSCGIRRVLRVCPQAANMGPALVKCNGESIFTKRLQHRQAGRTYSTVSNDTRHTLRDLNNLPAPMTATVSFSVLWDGLLAAIVFAAPS